MNVFRPITLDCTIDNLKREKLTGYEHGVSVFEITLKNQNQQIDDLTKCRMAVYYGTKADEHTISNTCYIKDNKVYLPVSLQMTTCFGYLNGSLELQFDTGNIRFYGLNFEVFPSPETAEIESTDENTLLESFLLKPESSSKAGQVLAVDENGNTYWKSVTGGSGGGTSDYNELENIPMLNGKEIKGDLTTADFNIENGKDGVGISKAEINANGELEITYTNSDQSVNLGKVVGKQGDSYTLTESDKTEIANIIKTEYDAELLEILGGDEDVTE